ncbi:MAG: right-handed parallel beta-helix repeat-containing protein [Myxococcota bacterium]
MHPSAPTTVRIVRSLALLALVSCGTREFPPAAPDTVLVRVDNEDEGAAMVSYRVWDEAHDLVSDVLFDLRERPNALNGVFEFTLGDDDDTPAEFRGGLLEVETWDAAFCPRGRLVHAFRYANAPAPERLTLSAPTSTAPCAAFFVAPEGSDETECTQDEPCREIATALERAEMHDERFIIHVAGGSAPQEPSPVYEFVRPKRINRGGGPPNVIRAWPGRAAPEPVVQARPRRACDTSNADSCGPNTRCVDGFCAPGNAFDICCQFDDSAPGDLEIDGFHTIEGRWSVEINGAADITVRHCIIDGGGGRQGESARTLPSGGVRVFLAPRTRLFHNLVRMSREDPPASPVLASGILIDGFDQAANAAELARENAAVLVANRIEDSQRAGVFIANPNGPVQIDGLSVCGSGGSALEIARGSRDVFVRNLLAVRSDDESLDLGLNGESSPDMRVGADFTGRVSVERSLLLSEGVAWTGEATVSGSVLNVEDAGEGNATALEAAVRVDGCLVGDVNESFGVCSAFPFCDAL